MHLRSPLRLRVTYFFFTVFHTLKALDTFDLDPNKWPELAADRLAWRAMLHSGQPPPAYRAPPPTPAALPIALTRPK